MNDDKQQDGVSVHAGFPNPATDRSLHGLDLNQLLVQHAPSTFLFRIRGQEWQEIGIFDGDIAIIDRALDARLSDVVIWWHEAAGEFNISVKKEVPAGAAIWGVVTASIHQFRQLTLPARPHKPNTPQPK